MIASGLPPGNLHRSPAARVTCIIHSLAGFFHDDPDGLGFRPREDHNGIPCLDLYFDGTQQTGTQTRLEAFMAQAAEFAQFARSQAGRSRVPAEVVG